MFITKEKMNKSIIYLIMLSLVAGSVLALELPDNLKKVKDYNKSQAGSLSFLVAFLGGILSLLSPCVLPVLPAFFAYSFREERNITKVTLAFFLGMSLVFIIFGVLISILGVVFDDYRVWITITAGMLIIILGIMTLFGKGFSFIHTKYKPETKSALSVFMFGMLFSVGFTPCVGPVLSAILLVASTLNSITYSAFLLFTYSLGFILPLFVLSFFYDKYRLHEKSLFKGKEFTISGIKFHSHKFAAGILLIILGIMYIIDKGTYIANKIDPFGTKELFYFYNDKIINTGISRVMGNVAGIILIVLIALIIFYIINRKEK